MTILFEVIKIIFFLFTVLMGVLMTDGALHLGEEQVLLYRRILLPAYLILMGIVFGYVMSLFFDNTYMNTQERDRVATTSFVGWMIAGTMGALMYIFVL